MTQANKTLQYYKLLPYTLRLEPLHDSDGSNYWVAEYTELRGCKTDGDNEAEAVANLNELFDEYISSAIEDGLDIPEPAREVVTDAERILKLPAQFRFQKIIKKRWMVIPSEQQPTHPLPEEGMHETKATTFEALKEEPVASF